jgi:hypothetical protein
VTRASAFDGPSPEVGVNDTLDWADGNVDDISERMGVEESQGIEDSTHTSSSIRGSTDLRLQEMDEMGKNGMVVIIF